jgi:YkoY family integral membrane protein
MNWFEQLIGQQLIGQDLNWFEQLIGQDLKSALPIILGIIVFEGVLSVDNAAVLATMVRKLPPHLRGRALKIGLIFGLVLRGGCLLAVNFLTQVWWVGPIGGLYLLWLAFQHFTKHEHVEEIAEEAVEHEGNWLFRHMVRMFGVFWATVLSVELMDLMFSIDNVLVANALTKNTYLICMGVFVGILAMRFAAQGFVKLMHSYPFLETCAFLVVGLLGLKLVAGVLEHFQPDSAIAHLIESQTFKIWWSVFMLLIFIVPVVTHRLFGWPRHKS